MDTVLVISECPTCHKSPGSWCADNGFGGGGGGYGGGGCGGSLAFSRVNSIGFRTVFPRAGLVAGK